MKPAKIFLEPMTGLKNCPCYVERTESGEVISSDLNLCAFKIDKHWAALERAIARLKGEDAKFTASVLFILWFVAFT